MRSIKFRAWDKKTKKMYFNVEDTYDGMSGHEDYDSFGNLVGNYEVELMQYTGLKDSKGVEVYEGDIVFFTHDNKPVGYKGRFKVIYRDCNFVITDKDDRHNFWLGSKRVENLEVIGNIYENPELLEGELEPPEVDFGERPL